MKDSDKLRIENQFSAFCVKVLKNAVRNIQREYSTDLKHRKSIDDLSEKEKEQIAVTDRYFMDEHIFEVQGLPVVVVGNVLAQALEQLPQGKRDIVLMFYFLGKTDREISELLNVVRQTVTKQRRISLEKLRKFLSKEGYEWL